MNESILTSIKKSLGIEEDYEHFDAEIIMHINSVLMILNQLGVGPSEGYSIEDRNDLWEDFISDAKDLELIKSYISLRVKLMFDNSTLSAAVIDVMERMISEYEFRINVEVDPSMQS